MKGVPPVSSAGLSSEQTSRRAGKQETSKRGKERRKKDRRWVVDGREMDAWAGRSPSATDGGGRRLVPLLSAQFHG